VNWLVIVLFVWVRVFETRRSLITIYNVHYIKAITYFQINYFKRSFFTVSKK